MSVKALYVQEGEIINFLNTTQATIPYGDVVIVGTQIGIAAANIAPDLVGAVHMEGAWVLPSVNNAAFSVGDALFWDADNEVLTKSVTAVTAGICINAKAQAGTTATVLLQPLSDLDALDATIGDVADLTTTAKNTLVAAVNEVDAHADTADAAAATADGKAVAAAALVGTLANLTTTAKTSVVAAINELVSRVAALESH